MTYTNKATVNFSGGEVSPYLVGRTDLPLYSKVVSRMENWISEPQGPARFRNGTVFVHQTRRNNPAVLIPFQFNDSQAYLIEATNQYFRFYKTSGLVLEASKTISGVTVATTGVVAATGSCAITGSGSAAGSVSCMSFKPTAIASSRDKNLSANQRKR